MAKLQVTGDKVAVSGDTATVHSDDLAALVKQDKEAAAKMLTEHVAPINASDLSVDAAGRVSIANAEFASLATELAEGTNFICPDHAAFC